MAIFSVSVKAHSRSKGESATGGAAYRLGVDLTNELTGERHNYASRKDIAAAFTLLPENAPAGWEEPARLWNEAEAAEKRKNSCVSREVLVALPAEMTDQQREDLTRSIAGDLVGRYGVGLSVGIHRPDNGGNNHHAHILMTTRRLGPDGLGEKTRELDDQKQGPEQVLAIREMVASLTNEHLQRHGYTATVDHRSLADQKQAALENGDLEKAADLSRAATKHHGRNPEVAARVIEANAATKANNEHTQAEARAGFSRLEAEAAKQARLMEPASDTPKSREAMEREQREERQSEQKAERAKVWAGVLAAREGVTKARWEALEQSAEKAAAKAGIDAAEACRLAALASEKAYNQRAAKGQAKRATWEKEHPFRALIGWEPKELAKVDAEATRAARKAEEAKAQALEQVERKATQKAAYDNADAEHRHAVHRLGKAEEVEQKATREHKAIKERHAYENLTPEQKAEQRAQELAERDRALQAKQEAQARREAWTKAQEWHPNQTPTQQPQQSRGRGMTMKPRGSGWGQSL